MTSVHIPFKAKFKEAMLSEKKILTSRTKRYGAKGDTFEAFGATFHICRVIKKSLAEVTEFYFQEGCSSKEDFVKVWRKIHPRKGYIPKQMVWLHQFYKEGAEK